MNQENKHPLDQIKPKDWGVMQMTNYRGCIVTKQVNGLYSLWGTHDLLPEGVDAMIDKSNQVIGKSIVR